jgi:hypothetical protein
MKTWLLPRIWERRYKRFLSRQITDLRKEMFRQLGRMDQFAKYRDKDDSEMMAILLSESNKLQSDSEKISAAVAATLLWYFNRRNNILATIRGYFSEVNKFNDEQFRAVLKSLTGLSLPRAPSTGGGPELVSPLDVLQDRLGPEADVLRNEPYLDGVKTNWENIQVVYVDKATQGLASDIELILRQGLATGAAVTVIVGTIDKATQTANGRIEVFGENQVNNLDVELTEGRQRSIGVNQYEWETRRDERVRGNPLGLYPKAKPSHYARDRQIFNWNNPPEGGHPGQAPGCRCRAIMRLPRR